MTRGQGDDAYRYGKKIKLDFSANVYNHADLTGLQQHLAANMDCIRRYPEPEAYELEWKLSEHLDIPREYVMVTNGCTEAIYLLAQLYRGFASVIPQPTFSEYANACRIHKHIISYENTDSLSHLGEDRIYWLCNPNNPSGNVLMKGFMDYTVRSHRQYMYIVDQSFEHYTKSELFTPHDILQHPNLIVLHSMTQQYAVPGLRLGYITASPSVINRLRSKRHPWSVSSVAIAAGLYLLQHGQGILPAMDDYLGEAERLRTALKDIPGIRMFESKSTFMLGYVEDTAKNIDLKQSLIQQYGILIRDCSTFEGLTSDYFRVMAQLPEENDQLVAAIRELLS